MGQITRRWAALGAAGTVALAGCAGGDTTGSPGTPTSGQSGGGGTGSDDRSAPSATAPGDASGDSSDGDSSEAGPEKEDSSDAASDTDTPDPTGTHIARTAGLALTVEDVDRAGARVRSAASSAGGYVSSEETRIAPDDESSGGGAGTADVPSPSGTGPSGTDGTDAPVPPRAGSWGEIVLTVPVDELDGTMTRLSRIGEVTQRTSDAEDLSTQYTDTESRVRTLEKSVSRLQELIDSTEDLQEIVDLEKELSDREADLESMVSQQKSLERRTTTAPITVSLRSPEVEEEPTEEKEEVGFLVGLASGWDGFTSALTAGLTVLGAITPFAVTGLLMLTPLAWWIRRRAHRGATGS